MLASARAFLPGRLSAVLVALALTGGLPLAEGPHGDEAPHRCHCHHGPGELCVCAVCQRGAAAAAEAELEKLPPCHRTAAKAARQAARRTDRADRPAWSGCCSSPGPSRATLATAEPFLLPAAVLIPASGFDERLDLSQAGALDLRREPPTPPPRAA